MNSAVLPDATPAVDTVLVVENESTVLASISTCLRTAGFNTLEAIDGPGAIEILSTTAVDVLVSALHMPDMGGIQLLRAIRVRDLDLPVILMTGLPSVMSAVEAVEFGAFRYLVKPVDLEKLAETVRAGMKLRRLGMIKREAVAAMEVVTELATDRASLAVRFERALETLWMAYQPIISWSRRELFAYEALVRSDEPGLRTPLLLLQTAETLDRLPELGHTIRAHIAEAAGSAGAPLLFVNLHPADLLDEALIEPTDPLAPHASNVVLEITERATLEGKNARIRGPALRQMGYRLAVDDIGAGYAGLSSILQLEPEVLKIDMSLVRGIDTDPMKQRLVRSMVELCADLGCLVVMEGVETVEERDTLVDLGCDLLQGYFFGRPAQDSRPPFWAPRDREGASQSLRANRS